MANREVQERIPFTAEELQRLISEYEKKDGEEKELIERLLGEKDRFKFVFRTDKSYYFVLNSGESFRIRWGEERYESTKIFKHVYFIGRDDCDVLRKRIEDSGSIRSLVGARVRTQNFAPGTFPLEIDSENPKPQNIAALRISPDIQNGNIYANIHLGREISEVIKA